MRRILFSSLIAAAVTVVAAAPAEAVPTEVSFAGRLADAAGPIDGSARLEFRIFEGPTMRWQEVHDSVPVDAGLVFVALGRISVLDATVFTGPALQLEIAVNGETMSPRLSVASVPYATRTGIADDALLLGGMAASAFAPVSHDHDGDYLPLGTMLTCGATQKVLAVSPMGDLVCANDLDTQYAAAVSGGLAISGNAFSIAPDGVTAARIANDAVGPTEIANDAIGPTELAADAVGSSEIAAGAVTSSELATDAVRRANLSGTELGLYLIDDGCFVGGNPALYQRIIFWGSNMGTPPTCPTQPCGGGLFYTCSGTCGGAPLNCAPNLQGYLVGADGL